MSKNEWYISLAGAIVKSAMDDYLEALLLQDKREIEYYETWFLSDYAELLSAGHGQAVIDVVRQKAQSGQIVSSLACRCVRREFALRNYTHKNLKRDCAACNIEIQTVITDKQNYVCYINAADLPKLIAHVRKSVKL